MSQHELMEVSMMIIDLPKTKWFYHGNSRIKIKNGNLTISHLVSWRELAYAITISTKGRRCCYCKKKLKSEDITMDHLFPQDLGGPTIPNNLAPCCARCNSQKGNLTEIQYRNLLRAPPNKRKIIRRKFREDNEKHKRQKGCYLPKKWLTSRKVTAVIVKILLDEQYMGKRYAKIQSFYQEYGHMPYPIVVDRKNYLLDGFLVLMFAKNNGITRVPTIVLENVETKFD